jgi:hypothetical protein
MRRPEAEAPERTFAPGMGLSFWRRPPAGILWKEQGIDVSLKAGLCWKMDF